MTEISWNKRNDNTQPSNTILTTDEISQYDKDFLLHYF